jgi:ATP-dependent Clp protease, protease subunit
MKHIVFQAGVNAQSASRLGNAISQAVQEGTDEVHLYMASPGGDVIPGLGVASFIHSLAVPVTTYNIGQTDSVANVIFAAGKKRVAAPTASFLFHGVQMNFKEAHFSEAQMQEQYAVVKRLRESIASNISAYTGVGLTVINELMVPEASIISAEVAREKGVVDTVEEVKIPSVKDLVYIGDQ